MPAQDPVAVPATVTCAPSRRLIVGLAAAAAASLIGCGYVDTPGRLLLVPVAVVLFAELARCALIRPVLRADDNGLQVHTGLRRHVYSWDEVSAVRAHAPRRLVSVETLEVDLGESLVVIPAYRLGAPVDRVVTAVERLRLSAGERLGPRRDDRD